MTEVEVEAFVRNGKRIVIPVGEVPTRTPATFVNFGTSGVSYYRSLLPARHLEASVYIRDGEDLAERLVLGRQDQPVVVYSMPRDEFMYDELADMLSKGVRLIVDVDDYLRGFVGKSDHPNSEKYTDSYILGHEKCVQVADLVTCSTQFIADKYAAMGCNTRVIPNGIDSDTSRWAFCNREFRRMRDRDKLCIIGWSGSIGHDDAFKAVAGQLARVLRENACARFVSIGLPMMEHLPVDVHGQCVALPFTMFPNHPKVLGQFHINIGPTLPDDFYRSKSDLRLQEAWSAGQCFVGGPETYADSIVEGENGFTVDHSDPEGWYKILTELVRDRQLRTRVGRNGLASARTIAQTSRLWADAIREVQE